LNRRTHVPAPEADNVLEAPDDVIAAHGAEQEHIQGQGGGTDVAVPQNESAEQTSVRRIGGVVEIAVAVHEEQKHVSVSQVGAGRKRGQRLHEKPRGSEHLGRQERNPMATIGLAERPDV
jgi:hypothetical protein